MYLCHQIMHLAENKIYNKYQFIKNIIKLITIELTSRDELVELLNADKDLCNNVGDLLIADFYIIHNEI